MQIKYKIIHVEPADHSIRVRFYSDSATSSEEALAVRNPDTGDIIRNADGSIQNCRTDYNITLWQIPAPQGAELTAEIMRYAPRDWLELQGKVLDPAVDTSMSSLQILQNVEFVVDVPLSTAEPSLLVPKIQVNTILAEFVAA